MRRFLFLLGVAAFLTLPSGAMAAGQLIKGSSPAVYYLDEGKRYVFPNEKVFFSWYADFAGVQPVTDAELASYPLGGNVTYRPGSRLVKIQSDPRVYAVGPGGKLRWVASEIAAKAMFGDDWNRKIDDLADAFFIDYGSGEPVATSGDVDTAAVANISEDLAFRRGAPPASGYAALKFGAWSDSSVWGGRMPTTGSDVVIPQGVKVIYDLEQGPSLRTLDIRGELEMYPSKSTLLAVRTIRVSGTLAAGTEAAPLPADVRAEILLTGSAPTSDDGLRVDGGRLELHGRPVGLMRAKLAVPAPAGAATITLDAAPGWKVGDEILILSTSAVAEENETRAIAAIEDAKITLDRPLSFAHRAETDLRAEVITLSRNVIVRGAGEGMGAGVTALNRATVRVERAAFASLGRSGVRGMHPVYLDGLGAASASYVRGSVIRDSGSRCVVLRQTRDARIGDNAAFEARGHCFALDEGAETGNLLENNVAASVRAGAAGSGEELPAAFLIRNPGNRLEGNLAVASEGHGYWYDLPEKVVTNEAVSLFPRETALGAFSGNEVRAAAQDGLRVDDARGRVSYIPPQKAAFNGLRALMNGGRGFWIRGAAVEVAGAFLAENAVGGSFSAFSAALKDSSVYGILDNPIAGRPLRAPVVVPQHGFIFMDGPVTVSGVRFVNFMNGATAFGFAKDLDRAPDPRNGYRGVTFVNAADWRGHDPEKAGEWLAAVRDIDGGRTIAANSEFLDRNCTHDADANVLRCPGAYAQLRIALREPTSDRAVTFTDVAGGAAFTLYPGPAYDAEYAYMTVAEGGDYRVSALPALRANVSYAGQAAPLKLRIPASPAARVTSFDGEVPRASGTEPIAGEWAYDAAENEIILHLPPGAEWNAQW